MIKLTIAEKGGETNALSFDQEEVIIGRVQGNDIVLPKGNISKRHTKLSLVDGRLMVSDMKSTNGTYVNGRKIGEPTAVRGGDKIFVGDFLIVVDPAAGAAETTASGARRAATPPPPPPPPRPGARRSGAHQPIDDDPLADLGDLGDKAPPSGPSRAAPPPPPPPRPRATIATMALEDDSVDIGGIDIAPPSPAEISTGGGDGPFADLADDDAGDESGAGTDDEPPTLGGDAGDDVFGSHAAEDEDAAPPPPAPPPPPPPSRASTAPAAASLSLGLPDDEDEADAAPTPPPAVASRAAERRDISSPAVITLETLLADPTVTAILIPPGGPVEVERGGKLETIGQIGDGNSVAETVWQIANTAVPPPPPDNPVVDVRLPDGTRITALFPPITPAAVCAAIRKSTVPEIPLADVAGAGDVETILAGALASRRNLLLAGDAHAVATLAGALAGAFPADRRVVSVGAGVKSRPGWIELHPGNDPATLVRAAVAFRAHHLLVADMGGAELGDLLLAAARGQDGLIASVAARSATEALERLRVFATGALGAAAFPALVTTTIDLVVFAATTATGSVRIMEIAEPTVENGILVPTFVARRPDKNRAALTLDVAGVSMRLAAAIAVAGDGLPAHLVRH